ncbi:TolC family protein [Edaphobacter aggregans]|uniref:TolC family protein n=1 Tax=Edaphobacter aggregans TaxID=570835 RepID=UPI0009FFB58B|nr:TolC family protein [Edaphobacter aggregans]
MATMSRAAREVRCVALFSAMAAINFAYGQNAAPAQHITLSEAIRSAQANEPMFAAAVAAQRTAKIDGYLAKAALLPSVIYHNQVLYTQPNGQTNQGGQAGVQAAPIFIANNAVHEYASQASINETIGVRQFADAEVAAANSARASAELEVSRRGLVSAVVTLYYTVSVAETKQKLLQEALTEAQKFTEITRKRESAREVAHADFVKAQLQEQQRQRDLSDATVVANRVRLELALLLFPDPRTLYTTDSPGAPAELPTRDEVNRLAADNNPEIRSALAGVSAANAGVKSAKAAYLPDLALNFTYGIDAPQFATKGPEGVDNLGYSMMATVDIPVWDWFSTQKRVKQSEIQRDFAKVTLTAAQRRLIANLEVGYAEAAAARDQLDLLGQSVQTAAESLRLTNLRYTAGEATALEVVDAQNAYVSAQTSQADGVVRYETALSALQILTGIL